MNIRIFITALVFMSVYSSFSQKPTITLTFTAVDSATYVQMDSIKVMNRTQGGDTVLYWPDTTLTYQITPGDLLLFVGYASDYPVGIDPISKKEKQFQLFQGYPNPVRDQAVVSVYLSSKGLVNMMVADIRGRIVVYVNRELDKGTHCFTFRPGDERIYFLTARWNGITQSIKILTEGLAGGKTCKLEYIGPDHENPSLKQSQLKAGFVVQESGILDTPDNDTAYTFQFATNIPCPGTPTVTYEGQVYNTIQIFSQCWLKENLNVGTLIQGSNWMTDNGIIEKYCYNNEPNNCIYFGGLYQWWEMMQYTTQQGVQGICPPGLHIPTDEEWKVLEGAVDSQYGIGDSIWDVSGDRGHDAGTNLKTTSGWYLNGNGNDLFGFSGLPGGYCNGYGTFNAVGKVGYWWSSTETGWGYAFDRSIDYIHSGVYRPWGNKGIGRSVRCLRDN